VRLAPGFKVEIKNAAAASSAAPGAS
jgi:hypothetical protein